ncbi:sensor histidine kinase [Nocardioides sp. R-C-SC26]|uniref:ATP-binding protein n=1 Tax=Nocardioides sp. R-C-SC26 TaxID=2870414 RepID=UPI001E45D97B|nr:sensor histidine kinase [Nocardioides sp. R-C-SC26]
MVRRRRSSSVARQIWVLQAAVLGVLIAVSLALAVLDARHDERDNASRLTLAVARAISDAPTIAAAMRLDDPSAVLQPLAEQIRADTDVDFVTIMDLDRVRLTHPDPARIGELFLGDVGTAPQGRPFTQEFTGTLGPSMRTVAPVMDDGRVVALVAVGITVQSIEQALRGDLITIGAAAAAVFLVGALGTWLVTRRLRRQTHGLGEQEITRMYEYYTAVLRAVREGLILVDRRGRVAMLNQEAQRLLDLSDDAAGRSLAGLGLAPALVGAALGGESVADELFLAGDRALLVSAAPAAWGGREVGAVITLRDHTELRDVTGELDVVRGLTESLRSQTHEAANRLHTVVSLVELGRTEEAIAFATEELAVAQRLTDDVVSATTDPVVAALLLGKTAEAAERGVELVISGSFEGDSGGGTPIPARDLVTVLGNLIDNALDAVGNGSGRRIEVHLDDHDGTPLVSVGDDGPGLTPEEARRALSRGWSTKAAGRGVGLALVRQTALRHGGDVTIGRSTAGGALFHVRLGPLATAPAPADLGAAPGQDGLP